MPKNKTILRGLVFNILVSLPALVGFGLILFSNGPLTSTILSAGSFIAGFTGVIVAIRKESPTSIGSTRGKFAMLEGVIFTIICWGTSLYISIFGL